MHLINSFSLGTELKLLFDKYYFLDVNEIDFKEYEVYAKALSIFQYDYNRYFPDEIILKEKLFTRVELIGILLYRIAREHFLLDNEKISSHFSNLGRIISGFEIFYSAEVGKGIKINHGLGTVIGARCIIGQNSLIHQNVTLGDKNGKRPLLLNNVTVYAGAKILGGVILGNNSIVAANAVCLIDVPEFTIVAGVPGKIKKKL